MLLWTMTSDVCSPYLMSSINNADIFDEEELLAIANDSDDDSSGGSSSSSSSASASSPHVEERVQSTSKSLPLLEENATDKRNERHNQSQHESITKHMSDESSSDDDDDDDGFLESWLDAENAKKKNAVPAEVEESQVEESDEVVQDEVVLTHVNKKATIESEHNGDESKKNIDVPNESRTELQLGTSVLNWISGRGRKTNKNSRSKLYESDGSNVGLVAIERTHEDDKPLQSTTILRLTTTNLRKRMRAGASDTITATLEEDSSYNKKCSPDTPKKCIGQATFPTKTDGAMPSSDGAMVDCLAIYDRRRRCYVLEIVDCVVTELKPSSENNDVVATSTRNKRTTDGAKLATKSPNEHDELDRNAAAGKLIDPRSSTKRADYQIKLLKRKWQK